MRHAANIGGSGLAELQAPYDALFLQYYQFSDMIKSVSASWPPPSNRPRMEGDAIRQTAFHGFGDVLGATMMWIGGAVKGIDNPRYQPIIKKELAEKERAAKRELAILSDAIAQNATPEERPALEQHLEEIAQQLHSILKQVKISICPPPAAGMVV